MKTTLIKIKRSSIRKNKDAGKRDDVVGLALEITFSCSKIPKELKGGENCYITSVSLNATEKFYEGILLAENLIEVLVKKGVNIAVKKNWVHISHLPIPLYDYEYKDTKVRCSKCGSTFSWKRLRSEESPRDEDGDSFCSNRVCPVCGEWNCCDIEFEILNI